MIDRERSYMAYLIIYQFKGSKKLGNIGSGFILAMLLLRYV